MTCRDEAREHEREEGIKITPFKLEGDEEEGTYNEDGVFVLGNGRKGRDGEEDDEEEDGDADEGERGDDEWFRSEGGQELEEQARINHEAQLKAMREANAARKAMGVAEEASIKVRRDPVVQCLCGCLLWEWRVGEMRCQWLHVGDRDERAAIGAERLQKRMIGYLEAGETVAAALRRIGALVEEQRRSRRGKGGKEVAEEDEVARKKREFEEKAQRMQVRCG